jgi:aspartyl-tRNA(Asn)/glutamyl-tRNA(Gln) amidotransferase subunit A
MGASVEEAHPGFDDPGTFFESIVALESDMALLRQVVAEHPEAVNPRIARLAARAWEFGEVSSAMTRRKETYNHLWRFFERYDLLVTPTAAVAAYDVEQGLPREIDGSPVMAGHYLSWFTSPFNLTGNPAASVPCGWTEQGLPVGLQIVGNHLADALVLRASRALEVAAPWTGRKPAILEPAS